MEQNENEIREGGGQGRKKKETGNIKIHEGDMRSGGSTVQ